MNFMSAESMVSLAGEIARKIKGSEDLRGLQQKEETAKQLSELLFVMFVVAERLGVSLEDSFLQTVDEMILRFIS